MDADRLIFNLTGRIFKLYRLVYIQKVLSEQIKGKIYEMNAIL